MDCLGTGVHATQWTASVHALHMPKPNVTRVQSATQWTASVHSLHMPKPVMWNVSRRCMWKVEASSGEAMQLFA